MKLLATQSILSGLAVLGFAAPTLASEVSSDHLTVQVPVDTLDTLSNEPMNKVTNVAELTDIKATDWAFQALQSLVERYGVLSGYPDKTFRGNRPVTRNEFAAALRQALLVLDTSQFATREDWNTLQRLMAQFKVELANAETEFDRVKRTINQFSITTRLEGQVILALTGVANARKANDNNQPTDSNLTFGNRISLELNTSFKGKDLLKTALKTGNIYSLDQATGTDMARLSFQNDEGNAVVLDELLYRRRLTKRLNVNFVAVGGSLNKFAETFNPFAESSGDGVISRFAQRNPIYRQGGGAGLGLSYDLNDVMTLSVGYLADAADQPNQGIFGDAYAAIAQFTVNLSKTAGLGLTYIHSYNGLDTATGSERANNPFQSRSNAILGNSWGLQGAIGLGRKLVLSGWVGLTQAQAKDLPNNPTANIINWATMLSFPDLGKEGNLGGIVFGQPPKVTSNEFVFQGQRYSDRDTSFHLEAFYRYRINDSLTITPGVLVLFQPEHTRNHDNLYIGTIRTTFSF